MLILLLVGLTKAEAMLGGLVEEPAPSRLQVVAAAVGDALNDAPTGDALPVPHPQLRLAEAHEDLAA